MKKRITLLFTLLNLIMVAAFTAVLIYCTKLQSTMSINIYFGESHAGKRNIGQLFYAERGQKFSSNSVLTQVFEDDVLTFPIGDINFKNNKVRLEPFNVQEDFSIIRIDIVYGRFTVLSLQGDEIAQYIKSCKRLEYVTQQETIAFTATDKDPKMTMKREFSDRIYRYYLLVNRVPYCMLCILYLVLGYFQIRVFKFKQESSGYQKEESDDLRHNGRGIKYSKHQNLFQMMLADIMVCLGTVFIYAVYFFEDHFGQVPFGQLVYHLRTPLEGTDISSYYVAIAKGVVITLGIAGIAFAGYVMLRKRQAQRGYIYWISILAVMMIIYAGVRGFEHFGLLDYYRYTHESTTLYEDYYVDGRDVELIFPEKKRNLIYIFLESMEITYADTASGGAMQTNYIPELTHLMQDNISFSEEKQMNGAYQVSGATYTMGALAAQTCGVPINELLVSNETLNGSWESENNYLPGAWSIGDILQEAGYNQEFLIGSNGKFAGRSSYFKGHGDYQIEDYKAAQKEQRVATDYHVWWGYEDEKLFDFAKEDVLKLAAQEEPFNLTMLTVDTHASDGYKCELCQDDFPVQYSNVIACSSRQVSEFVEWIQEQDFYENTTIVLAGDHLTPDSYYITNEGVSIYDRKVYVTVINPAEGAQEKGQQRNYSVLDLFPTTLAGMGVIIEGDRLGLGVNLFSDVPTLVEEKGIEYLNTELLKNSNFYTRELLYTK